MLSNYKIYDTHTHYNADEYQDLDSIYDELKKQHILTNVIGTDLKDSMRAVEIAKKYENAFATIAIHPTTENINTDADILKLEQLLQENLEYVVAIGECGLDYHFKNDDIEKLRQKELFRKQIELSIKYDKPLVLHIRDAHDDAKEILSEYSLKNVIVHCFTGTLEDAIYYQSKGYYVSFSGIITFKKSQEMRDICSKLNKELILTETDLPWLSPEPHRGKTNSSFNMIYINEVISKIYSVDIDIINNILLSNARKAFKI